MKVGGGGSKWVDMWEEEGGVGGKWVDLGESG